MTSDEHGKIELRWVCPTCDHQIIGVEDWDECAELIDGHLQAEHGLTIQQYMEDGMTEVVARDE